MHGYTKTYFLDETGRFFRDDTGNRDHNNIINFEVELGRNNFETEAMKTYHTAYVYSEKALGTQILVSIDGGQFNNIGQITKDIEKIVFSPLRGRDVNYKFTNNSGGETPGINGVITMWAIDEREYA